MQAETPSSAKKIKAPDVILEASCGHSLLLFSDAAKAASSSKASSSSSSIVLNEDAGWIDSRTKRPPGVMDFLGVLAHLSALKIRGGFSSGAETTRLSSISVAAGKMWFPCCTIDSTVEMCQNKPSPYYNPPNLRYFGPNPKP